MSILWVLIHNIKRPIPRGLISASKECIRVLERIILFGVNQRNLCILSLIILR